MISLNSDFSGTDYHSLARHHCNIKAEETPCVMGLAHIEDCTDESQEKIAKGNSSG